VGAPTYATLNNLQREISSNAASVHSDGGDGASGHLALTISHERYLELSDGVPFIAPVNPNIAPVHPANATGPMIAEINRQHLVDVQIFRTYKETDKALRQQLIAAVQDDYISGLCHPVVGYGKTTCLQLLTHLWTHFGKITADELEKNRVGMRMPWDPSTSIKSVFTKLTKGRLFAEAGNDPITETTAIRDGYFVLLNSGVFSEDCRRWRDKPEAEKTLAAFQLHFRAADKDRCEMAAHTTNATTTGSAGFTGNQVVQVPSSNKATTTSEMGYCWTHGCMKNPAHTSTTCKRKADGHKDNATMANKMGGKEGVWKPRPCPVTTPALATTST
jgi:hypothetical protein